ncbi:hypothetical protein ATE76_20960 [Sphingopyxis sp. H093]|nr:hypothetical protein ATE76_20960 [Sphingopyxis sp. H093]KTE28408.1 hypothetical protein ATE75_12340 [Sphingopyxis sp. H080]
MPYFWVRLSRGRQARADLSLFAFQLGQTGLMTGWHSPSSITDMKQQRALDLRESAGSTNPARSRKPKSGPQDFRWDGR